MTIRVTADFDKNVVLFLRCEKNVLIRTVFKNLDRNEKPIAFASFRFPELKTCPMNLYYLDIS